MSDDEVPELELCDMLPDSPQIDRRELPIGDPERQFDEEELDAAFKLKSDALKICHEDPDLALEKLTTAIEMFPTSTLFLTARAQLFFQENDYFLAMRDANLSIERGGPTFRALKLKGECHDVLREFRDAESCFKEALQLENDEEVVELLHRTEKQAENEEIAEHRFEQREEKEKREKEQKDIPKSVQERMNEEIEQKHGENPVYESPLFKNLFNTAQNMNDDRAQELMKNEVLMQALNSEDFDKKLQDVARDPAAAAKYANDEGFMKAFAQILGEFK